MSTLKSENFEPCEPSTKEILPDLSYNEDTLPSALNSPKLDRFKIFFTLPKCVYPNNTFKESDKLLFYILNLPTPEINVPALESNYMGHKIKHSTFERIGYDDITINFKIDGNFEIYNTLYKWLNFLDNESTNQYGNPGDSLKGNPAEYTTTITIAALDPYDNEKLIASWDYKEAFITKLGKIEWDAKSENVDATCSFDVSFNSVHFTLPSNSH